MTTVTVEDQLIPIEKILDKPVPKLTFKETISLFFHAATLLSVRKKAWKSIMDEFYEQLSLQNQSQWPFLTIIKNDYYKRIDILAINKFFIDSDNIFTLLMRLLFMENYKRSYIYKSYQYHKILNHKLISYRETVARHMSLDELVTMLKNHLTYYLKVYCTIERLEHKLAITILRQLE